MRHLRSFLLVAAMLLAAAVPAHAAAVGGCPGESAPSRERVRQFLAAPHLREVRSQLGLAAATPQHLRPLSEQGDEAACRAIRSALATDRGGRVPAGHLALYEADGFYFAAISRPAQPRAGAAEIREDSSVLFVFDREFRLVSRLLA